MNRPGRSQRNFFEGMIYMSEYLKQQYAEWRAVSEQLLEDGFNGSIDCGLQSVREDFSNFAELDSIISFEEMLELEREYDNKKIIRG